MIFFNIRLNFWVYEIEIISWSFLWFLRNRSTSDIWRKKLLLYNFWKAFFIFFLSKQEKISLVKKFSCKLVADFIFWCARLFNEGTIQQTTNQGTPCNGQRTQRRCPRVGGWGPWLCSWRRSNHLALLTKYKMFVLKSVIQLKD